MEEAGEFEVYDELESDEDAGENEPNFDEPTSDDPPLDSRSTHHELDQSTLGQSRNIASSVLDEPWGLQSPRNDMALGDSVNIPSQKSPSRGSSLGGESDIIFEVGAKKNQWPKLYKLPSELRHPVPEDRQEAVKFKLGFFSMRAPHVCRLRLSENMGILYLDKMSADDAGKIGSLNLYRSRVLCIVPDAFLDLSTTEIVLVWPQRKLRSVTSKSRQSANDATIKVVLFPSGRSNVPVLINTGLQGPTLLNF